MSTKRPHPAPRRAPAATLLLLGTLCAVVSTGPAFAGDPAPFLAESDARWARRAEGAVGGNAKPAEIDAAIAAARQALAADGGSVEARWRLVRALFFRGVYCAASPEEKKKLFGEAKAIGDNGLAALDRAVGGAKGEARIAKLRAIPGAAPLHFWTAACWGEWALAYGKMAAAKEGAAGTIRDLAQAVIALDPAFEEGGGSRILGRLHHQSPRIPFVTGWVSRDEGIARLRAALAAGPENRANLVFLAEALLDDDDANGPEARKLLETAAKLPPRPASAVEDAHYSARAAALLAKVR